MKTQGKSKRVRNINMYYANAIQKKAGVTIYISDDVDFRARNKISLSPSSDPQSSRSFL